MRISLYIILLIFIFFFKQKTAYDMRISDWSSDVCSSDLLFVERVDLGTRFGQGLRHHDGLSLLTLGRQKAADFTMIRGPVWPAAGQSGTAACRTRYRPTITRVASTPGIDRKSTRLNSSH